MVRTCERMGDEKLAKIADAQKLEGKRGEEDRGRADGVKRDLGRVGREWRTTAKYRRSWRLVIEKALRER